jgi:hypothetical protein
VTKSCGPSQQKLDGEERERESQVCGQWVSILGQHHAGPINVLFQFLMSSPGWNASQEDSLAVRNEPRCIAEQDILGSTSIATLEAVCVYKQAGLAKRGLFQALWCENLEMLCPTKMVHILAKIVSVLLIKTIYSEKIGDVQHNSFDYRISIIVQGLHVFFDSFSDCLAVTTREGQVQNLIKDKTV